MKFGFQEIRVDMGLFDFTVICIVGDYKNITKYICWKFEDKDFYDDVGAEARGRTFYRRGYVPVIWIPRMPKTPREYATLSHEAIHAIFKLFGWAGIPITSDTEELMTHSVAHVVNAVLSSKK